MSLGGYIVKKLEGKTDTETECMGKAWQETVIIAFAPTETMPLTIECHTGNDGKVYLVIKGWRKEFARGFHDAVGSWTEGGFAIIDAEFEVVANNNGQQDPMPQSLGLVKKWTNVHLVRKRII